MALKRRWNRVYPYRSKRVGDRVVSEYGGKGDVAVLMAQAEALLRDLERQKRAEERAELARLAAEEQPFADAYDGVEAIFQAAMTDAGYHLHRRETWRKRRRRHDDAQD